jgi:(E)-4-hydroxy-3-methylbut-2-enyl-diphosphate synthase
MSDCEFKGLEFKRRKTRQIKIGNIPIGGEAPISVQSMTKTHTQNVADTINQIRRMEDAGCEIVRLAVPDKEAALALGKIKKRVSIPLIADIHFDHRLALAALDAGVEGLRINPGNIGTKKKVKEVVLAAKEKSVPIRIGVNSGSLEKDLLQKYGEATPEAMVESAMNHVRILEDLGFDQMKISLKASDIFRTLKAYQLMAEKVDYPFHVGITEAGSIISGTAKSAAGIALLLREGLVDTLRVSLTAPPEEEVRVAYLILSSLGIRSSGPNIVSCPICGRCEVDFANIANEIERELSTVKSNITIAVMGCMVNGPGEAKEADIGLACGRGVGVVFKKGKLLRRLKEEEIVPEFISEVLKFIEIEA